MKRILILSLFISSIHFSLAQAPQAMNYQAVARTANGSIIPAQNISVRFSVLDASVNGNVLYQETHQATTNNYGLFTLAIGKGSPINGTFSQVDWASGTDKFLKVEIAPDGTSNYQLQGTTQLLSVPYALYSEKTRLVAGNAISITNGNTVAANYSAGTGINISGSTISGAYQSGTGININGNTISGAYQGGTGININGNTVSHALQGGTGININGATISHALQAGTGININGATISHNLQAGTGISINGNIISASGSNQWLTHANGIYYDAGKVAIGMTPHPIVPLSLWMPNSNAGNAILHLRSNDFYHSALSIFNGEIGSEKEFSFLLAGPSNQYMVPGSFGLFNHQTQTYGFVLNSATNYMAVGSLNPFFSNTPRSRLHVFGGDVNIDQIGSGIIMKSQNGNCWRVTIDDSGNLVRTPIACP